MLLSLLTVLIAMFFLKLSMEQPTISTIYVLEKELPASKNDPLDNNVHESEQSPFVESLFSKNQYYLSKNHICTTTNFQIKNLLSYIGIPHLSGQYYSKQYYIESSESSVGDNTNSFYLDIYIDSTFLQVEIEQSPIGFIHNGYGELFNYCRVFKIIKDKADKRKPKNTDDINFIYDNVISVPYESIRVVIVSDLNSLCVI
ncbi:37225_t:CDS:2 [Gigaspora margarita]|uniref:37225_t:CDS:1 n=1 Tax=Gigaspora margarita TaxID=4874 RepID=A0ABN7URA4_GIGMA|nr:37225_t:CDS:2 [Gigaspora margarita]